MRELALHYGVYAEFIEIEDNHKHFLNKAVAHLQKENLLNIDDLIVVLAGNFGVSNGPSFIEIGTARKMLKSD